MSVQKLGKMALSVERLDSNISFSVSFGCASKDHGVDQGSQDGPLRNTNSTHQCVALEGK